MELLLDHVGDLLAGMIIVSLDFRDDFVLKTGGAALFPGTPFYGKHPCGILFTQGFHKAAHTTVT